MSSDLNTFIDAQVAEFRPRLAQYALSEWNAAITSTAESEEELSRQTRAWREMIADPARYKTFKSLFSQNGRTDPVVAREAKLLDNLLRGSQISHDLISRITELEVQIQGTFVRYRALVRGERVADNDLDDILHESNDSELCREAWEASKQIGAEVVDKMRELARLRNQAARQIGFENFYSMRLELDELNETEVFDLFDRLRIGMEPAWQKFKNGLDAELASRFNLPIDQLRPWHYGDRFFQKDVPSKVNLDTYFADRNLEAITRAYYSTIDLDIDDILARSDLYERDGKNQHAFCIHIDREGDVRVLCNLRPTGRWAETMLHEFGHAVYDKYIDRQLPYLLREPAHILTTEAIALMGGDHVHESAWLHHYAGVPADEAQRIEVDLREAARASALVFVRWVFVMCHFERALYRDPEQDLNTLWWDLVERFQSLHRPDNRYAPDWASKYHIGTSPVYYQNYLLGSMMAAQLREYILRNIVAGSQTAYVMDPRVGHYLLERVFKPGSTRDWRGWLQHATGQDLSVDFYVQQLSG